jgi:ribokinase
MSPHPIVVVGSSNTDLILRVPHIPVPGETILGGKFLTAPGGKGANQAIAAARAGGSVILVAKVGQDHYGEAAIAGFQRDGIDVTHVSRDKSAPSGVALIFVSATGENCIGVADSANSKLSPADVQAAAGAIAAAGMLILQLEIPLETVLAAAALATAHGVPVILNPAPAQTLPDELLAKVTLLTPNETECEILTGIQVTDQPAAAKAASALLARGVQTVIITMGKRGAYVATRDEQRMVPGFHVDPVDTTAAGDVFNGSLAVALVEGQSLPQAVRFAHAAAALSVTKPGAQSSAPDRPAIDNFLNTAPAPEASHLNS